MSTAENRQPAGADSITGSMTADHQRIAKLWDETITALKREDFAAAHTRAAEFIAALRRHIAMEEQILFPAIDEKTGMHGSGPTYAMRMEHREIERMLERLAPLLTVQERWTGIQAVEGQPIDPYALLHSHDMKEEMVLYPMADQILGADATRKLVERMRTEVNSPATAA
ncbi:MAG TPA: hemerythrin domain-containing protein [Candidatus Binataceae bacterium]|nr:hemerythrin domain-containing protein [Candidatus Binataceae bacterium]